MCGRYDNLIAREAYRAVFGAERLPQSNFPPRYNVAPTDQIPIIRVDPRDGQRELVMARWGLVPWWSKTLPKIPHINARAETVHEKALFREAFAKRRALIPATGFFEWQKRADGKQPYRFRLEDLQPFAFAGLWEFARLAGEDILSATIIVGEPNPLTAAIHDRMPVILDPVDFDRWLSADTPIDELRGLLKPYPADRMQAEAVNRAVNSVKNDDERCIGGDRRAAAHDMTARVKRGATAFAGEKAAAPVCARCDDTGWVCEAHPDRPWEGPRACGCGGAGDPCPDCNSADQENPPRLPEGMRVDADKAKGWRH